MLSRSDKALYDIRDCVLSAQQFIEDCDYDRFRSDRRTFHAVTRLLEIISEASRRLDPEIFDRHPHLPWREIRDAGNFYRHQYDDVAETYVWNTVVNRLSPLMAVVASEIERVSSKL